MSATHRSECNGAQQDLAGHMSGNWLDTRDDTNGFLSDSDADKGWILWTGTWHCDWVL